MGILEDRKRRKAANTVSLQSCRVTGIKKEWFDNKLDAKKVDGLRRWSRGRDRPHFYETATCIMNLLECENFPSQY